MATPYGNLSPGLQKILQDGLRWREGGAYNKELRRLQDMYPGFKQAKAQVSDEGLGERIFDSYRPSQEVTDMYDLVNQLYSNYSDLYSNFESTQKAQGESYKAALKEWNRQDKAGDAADWTAYTRLNKAYESADSRLKDIHTRLESSSKEYDKANKNYEKLKANPVSNVYTNPEGTFKNVGDDRWQNIATGNVRRADTFRNLNNTPVTSRMNLDREAKRADRRIALAINSDKVGRGYFETDKPRSAQPTLTEMLASHDRPLFRSVPATGVRGDQPAGEIRDVLENKFEQPWQIRDRLKRVDNSNNIDGQQIAGFWNKSKEPPSPTKKQGRGMHMNISINIL